MKKILTFIFAISLAFSLSAQSVTYKFADRDTCSLYLDLYQPSTIHSDNYCIVFVFGGGFITGQRNSREHVEYAKQLTERGYTVACIDYRLGLKGVDLSGLKIVKALDKAIQLAVEDLFSATSFLLKNADEFNISPDRIILCGSSAGAITALQSDYELCNRTEIAKILPTNFHYAGVISFSGAIYSHKGRMKYQETPAPTFLMHGMCDRLVPYKSIRFGNLGFFGSHIIAKQFEKYDYAHFTRRYEGLGHEVAGMMIHNIDITDWFITKYIKEKQFLQIDEELYDGTVKQSIWTHIRPSQVYRKGKKK